MRHGVHRRRPSSMRHILRCVAHCARVVDGPARPSGCVAASTARAIRGRVRAMKSVCFLVGLGYSMVGACSHPAAPLATPPRSAAAAQSAVSAPPAAKPITLTILGTNDLHGALDRLPLLAGFVANVRAARAADGGGVVLVDGGDMFQGTLESNL